MIVVVNSFFVDIAVGISFVAVAVATVTSLFNVNVSSGMIRSGTIVTCSSNHDINRNKIE